MSEPWADPHSTKQCNVDSTQSVLNLGSQLLYESELNNLFDPWLNSYCHSKADNTQVKAWGLKVEIL